MFGTNEPSVLPFFWGLTCLGPQETALPWCSFYLTHLHSLDRFLLVFSTTLQSRCPRTQSLFSSLLCLSSLALNTICTQRRPTCLVPAYSLNPSTVSPIACPSTWVSNKHLKFNMTRVELLISYCCLQILPPPTFPNPIDGNSILLINCSGC